MDFHILSTHSRGGNDGTPLQLISAEQLAYYKAMEMIVLQLATSQALAANSGD